MLKSISIQLVLLLIAGAAASAQIRTELPSFGILHDVKDTVELTIIGDVMMHSAQLEKDCQPFLENISHKLKEADISIANLEFALGGEPYSGYPAFSTPDYYPLYLAEDCGIDVFLTANNHVLDRGSKGLERTAETYDRMADSLGISYTGIASSETAYQENTPLIIRRKGIRIAIINFTYGTNNPQKKDWPRVQRMNKDELSEAFREARQKADFVLVFPHWGEEYQLTHSSVQEEWAGWLVDRGADAIIGTHPHVVQDSTSIKGVPVFYSLGNAVSNMSAINTRLELAVTLRFTKNRISGRTEMLPAELDFLWCTLPGRLTDNYSVIPIKEWAGRKGDWLIPSDYDNMLQTYERVKAATGIDD